MIQALIDQAPPFSTVRVPAGTYDVDAGNAPIMVKSNITLDLSQATLRALPNKNPGYKILWVKDSQDITIIGGRIIGERLVHLVPTPLAGPDFGPDVYSGGWGMGVSITGGSRNIKVIGTHVSQCYGDGVYVDWDKDTKLRPINVVLDGVIATRNRRQGASIICVDSLLIRNSEFSENGLAPEGTIPGAGIDFECDFAEQDIRNVVVEGNNKFFENRGSSIGVNGNPGVYQNITILPGNYFDMKQRPIWVAGGLDGKTPWWAIALNRIFGSLPGYDYRWWGYPTNWSVA